MFNYFTLANLWTLIRQILDIICVWAVVYYCMKIVKNNSRTIQIFKGVLLIVIVRALASGLGLGTIANLADSIMSWGVVAIIIIFQPEIRNILEKIGETNLFSRMSTLTINERENLVDELVKACAEMSKTKTGALISIEQGHSLSDFIKTGTPMNSVVSSELLCSIFQYGTPLHDGAVIIQGVKIACAAAYFPPTTRELPTSYGARHRAAVGISEITDSITIVVSEETGNISIAEAGKLTVISTTSLHEFLMNVVIEPQKNEHEKEKTTSEEPVYDADMEGKKPGVFAHYFKGKNKRTKVAEPTATKYVKKKKEESQKESVVVDKIEPIEIEDLAKTEEAPLDELFETIEKKAIKHEQPSEEVKEEKPKRKKAVKAKVEAVANEEEEPVKKKRGRKKKSEVEALKDEEVKEEKPKDKPASSIFQGMANDLLNDVIEPKAIVLHYEKADDGDEQPEGSDS